MTDVTNILGQIEQGDPPAVETLLPLVYEELRKLAAQRLEHEQSDPEDQPVPGPKTDKEFPHGVLLLLRYDWYREPGCVGAANWRSKSADRQQLRFASGS